MSRRSEARMRERALDDENPHENAGTGRMAIDDDQATSSGQLRLRMAATRSGSTIGFSDAAGWSPEVNWGSAKVTTSHTPIAARSARGRREVINTVTMPTRANASR